MIDSPRADSFLLSDYVAMLVRRSTTIATWTIVGAVAAFAYTIVGPKTYTASASVYVTANAANTTQVLGDKTATLVNMDNEAQVVTSTSVAKIAATTLQSPLAPTDLLTHVTVAVPANTQVLQISCSQSSASGAASCAQAFANAYLSSRAQTAMSKVQTQIQTDQARVQTLESQLTTAESNLNKARPSSAQAITAHAALANIESQLTPLRAAIASLGASNNYQAGYVISAAIPPAAPSSPRKLLFGPSGLMAGLLIGLVFAFVAERRDDRIHSAADVERHLDLPVLFALDRRRPGMQHELARPGTLLGRAFTELARVVAGTLGEGCHVLLVSGISVGTDVDLVAANLAAALATIQADVILVRADTRGISGPTPLGAPVGDEPGLANVIRGELAVRDVARPIAEVPRLRVILAERTQELVEMLPSDIARRLIADFHKDARYVIIATDSTEDDAIIGFAEVADAALVVVTVDATERAQIASYIRRLTRLRTEVLGAIVMPFGPAARQAAKRSAARARANRGQQAERAAREEALARRRLIAQASATQASQSVGNPPPGWENSPAGPFIPGFGQHPASAGPVEQPPRQ